MKAVLGMILFWGMMAAETSRADPIITSQNFKCDYRPRVDGKWEARGFVEPQLLGFNLSLLFKQDTDDFGPYPVGTTGNSSEHRVELRCSGSLTLSQNKPFKIRDFKFEVFAPAIGSKQGKIELKVLGSSTVTSTQQKDSFEKVWTIRQPDLERLDVFASKQESSTVCGPDLTLRFDELRAIAMREESSFDATELELQSLNITFDPC